MVFSIQEIIFQLQSIGFFDTLLPFLLVFAVVFGILVQMNIFGNNRMIHVVIAVVIAFLAIQSPFFTQFYSEIFPRLGIGITILLVLLILIGLFIAEDEQRYWFWGLGAIAAIIAIVIINQTFGNLGWSSGFNNESVGWIIGGIIFIGLIIAIAAASGGKSKEKHPGKMIANALFGPK